MKGIKKIAIVGVGFMGGSLARAVLKKFPRVSLWGYARSKKSLTRLRKARVIKKLDLSIERVVKDADLIVLALPVRKIMEYFKVISPFLKKGAIIIDLGSSKSKIQKAANSSLPKSVKFIGCHPLCGSEKKGVEFSKPELYNDSFCLITSSSKSKASQTIKKLWESLGAKVIFINAQTHDKILSSISHLPHILSFSLSKHIPDSYLKFAPASLKDLTRISASPASVWTDIFLTNKKNIIKDIKGFIKILKTYQASLELGSKTQLRKLILKANAKHKKLSK